MDRDIQGYTGIKGHQMEKRRERLSPIFGNRQTVFKEFREEIMVIPLG